MYDDYTWTNSCSQDIYLKAIKSDPLIRVYIEKVTLKIEKGMYMRKVLNIKIIDSWYEGVNISEFSSLSYNPVENILKTFIRERWEACQLANVVKLVAYQADNAQKTIRYGGLDLRDRLELKVQIKNHLPIDNALSLKTLSKLKLSRFISQMN